MHTSTSTDYAPDWAATRGPVTVEKRDAAGGLSFAHPQPPPWMIRTTADHVLDFYFREAGPDASNGWDAIGAWLAARGWIVRVVTW